MEAHLRRAGPAAQTLLEQRAEPAVGIGLPPLSQSLVPVLDPELAQRLPLIIWLTRFAGTLIWRANSVGVTPTSANSSFSIRPGWTARLSTGIPLSRMIVHNLDVARPGLSLRPLETDAPLPVYAYGILSFPISPEDLQPITWQISQRVEGRCGIQDREPSGRLLLKALEVPHRSAAGESLRFPVPVAEDHRGTT